MKRPLDGCFAAAAEHWVLYCFKNFLPFLMAMPL